MKTLDLIVPCYNEEAALPLFYETVTKTLQTMFGYAVTLIFVDDGSSDRTLALLQDLARRDSRVKYLSFSRNFGKESAMLAGLRASTAELVGILDADLQHSPALLPQMLAALEEGYDVAAAKRVDRAGETKLKSRLSDAFYRIANRMTEVEIDPGAQDFRVMKRVVADALLSLGEHRRFTKGMFSFVGFRTKWFPHENTARAAGETKWNFKKLFSYALDGIVAYSDLPLKLPFFGGGALCCCAVLYALIALVVRLCGKVVSPLHAVLIVLLLLGGLILCAVGILGVYLSRIY
ncbi:MAG: glycosyltransferase family 2 protein, partial [Clostridia bacterium]|nr:glycosyltransferase family 2 protein [Clostridia bacterium]